jgi:hypothetical protein
MKQTCHTQVRIRDQRLLDAKFVSSGIIHGRKARHRLRLGSKMIKIVGEKKPPKKTDENH